MITCLLVAVLALQTLTTSYVIPRSNTWSEWSACSLPCGGGVRNQFRPCTQVNCTGQEYQYQSCNLQPCNNSSDPRQDQCSSIPLMYPGIPIPGNWFLEQPDTNTCTLSCINSIYKLNIPAPDGTPCKTLERQAGFCFGNICLKSSCDGVLGSTKELDECLNCPAYNSNNSVSCNHHSGAVELNQTEDVANNTLRSGATTISLTIRGEATLMGLYDSQTVSKETQSFIIGGAEFTKQANGDLLATGPLVEDIVIMLESSEGETDPSVVYEYYLSEKNQIPDNGGIVYSWHYADFTECSATCGRGLQVSHAHCQDEEFPNKAIPDWFCNGAEKPLPIVRMCSQNACPPRWIAGEWSVCSAKCGKGKQMREVSCQQVQSDGSSVSLPDSNCTNLPKPNSTRACLIRECGEWKAGEWGQCSEDCGWGDWQREVYCTSITGEIIDDSNCAHLQRPGNTGPCHKAPCYYGWHATAWDKCSADCGMGTQSRDVCCATQYHKCVNETFCNQTNKPPSEQSCIDTSMCVREWRATNWSECSGSCENAQKEREVECFVVIDGNFIKKPISECDNMTRPDTMRHCIKSDCPTWFTGEWGPCSVTCGEGQMTRTVECQLNGQPATGCSEDTRPLHTQPCMSGPCPDCTDYPRINCVSSIEKYGCVGILKNYCCFTCSNV